MRGYPNSSLCALFRHEAHSMSRDSLAAGNGSQKHLMATATWTMGMKTHSTRAETRQTQRHQRLLVPTALHYISQKHRQFVLLYRTVKEYLSHNLLISPSDDRPHFVPRLTKISRNTVRVLPKKQGSYIPLFANIWAYLLTNLHLI